MKQNEGVCQNGTNCREGNLESFQTLLGEPRFSEDYSSMLGALIPPIKVSEISSLEQISLLTSSAFSAQLHEIGHI